MLLILVYLNNNAIIIIAALFIIIQLVVLLIFSKPFNNATLFIEAEGIKIKRFDKKIETIKWSEVIETNFEKVFHHKSLLSIKINLKLINNKSITISLERFIGQYNPLIPYQKIKEAIPGSVKVIDIQKPESQKEIDTWKSFLRFIKDKKNIPFLMVMGINSILYANLVSYNKPSISIFIIIIAALLWSTFVLNTFSIVLAFVIAIFPYKKMSYLDKFGRSSWIGIWVVQILFIIYFFYFFYFRHH